MKILCIGDVVGAPGLAACETHLHSLKNECGADVVIVNGENSADSGVGINLRGFRRLVDAGADIVTTGNHAFRQAGYEELFEDEAFLLRPANLPRGVSGHGFCVLDTGRVRVLCANLSGQSFMNSSYENPYNVFERILKENPCQITIVDFHAESTSEKQAFARCFDGRLSALFGTHTHVQTADETVFPGGTGYITDLGMCGARDSVIGVDISCALKKQRFGVPVRFSVASGPAYICGAVFDIDEKAGVCCSVDRVCRAPVS